MPAGYSIETNGDVALVAATPKTILGLVAGSGIACRAVEINVSFDGVSSVAEPVTVELCRGDGSGAGTSTSQTPRQLRGATRTVQCSGARNYSGEPTTLTVLKRWLVHPQTGRGVQLPLGREIEHTGAGGLFIRCTAPANVNAQADLEFEEG